MVRGATAETSRAQARSLAAGDDYDKTTRRLQDDYKTKKEAPES
jgi:hypothetical protein